MTLPKEMLYDWMGFNAWLFHAINSINGGTLYDRAMIALSQLSDHHNFPYYFATIAAFALISLLVRKAKGRAAVKQNAVAWLGALLVFAAGYAADGMAVKTLKQHFAYPRPYLVYPANEIRVLEYHNENDDHRSFPSGHVSFITVLVVALWPVLAGARWMGVLLIPAVAWSRIALGMHFPADTLVAFLLALAVMLIVRGVIYNILLKFGLRC